MDVSAFENFISYVVAVNDCINTPLRQYFMYDGTDFNICFTESCDAIGYPMGPTQLESNDGVKYFLVSKFYCDTKYLLYGELVIQMQLVLTNWVV